MKGTAFRERLVVCIAWRLFMRCPEGRLSRLFLFTVRGRRLCAIAGIVTAMALQTGKIGSKKLEEKSKNRKRGRRRRTERPLIFLSSFTLTNALCV